MSGAIERIWAADGPAVWALTPLSWLFGAATATRNLLFDIGLLRARSLGLPTISVGNLTVGGTGKTPVAAWVAQRLAAAGAQPAILLRGYGDDEPLVHRLLTPGIPVIADPDRSRAAAAARAQGATVLVLDDAFQHRQAHRDVDLVLVAAEQRAVHRLLPAGPLREGRGALRRASLLVVTRKSASRADAEACAASWTGFAGAPETAVLALVPRQLVPASAEQGLAPLPLETLRGRLVLAVSAIGNPGAFEAQLSALGAKVTHARFPDHHRFSAGDLQELVRRAAPETLVVCTLKDAVKLGDRWPRQAPPLWYLSQAIEVERGAAPLDQALRRLMPGSTQPT